MAKPIAFKPITVDFKADLERRLEKAPAEHAAALLAALDILEVAHREGVLDLVHGMIGAKDTIAAQVAKYAALPEGVAGIRNLLTAAKILTELDPEILDRLSRSMTSATQEHKLEQRPPSLWQLWKRTTSEDGRRGLSFVTLLLSSLGRSLRD
ncbi:MAG TPA: DUF1641 domain-containing protein [Edaphobacter sp.]|nr:DUF1641 domain-containing protein [Edaphobacter sp.]